MKEQFYDKLLNIKTGGGQKGFNKTLHYHRYEATPYSALEILFDKYELKSSDRVVDFGCGKGRLNFFIHYLFNASVIGVEMNESLYKEAIANRDSYLRKVKTGKEKIQFQYCLAEEYEINQLDNRFYFFNPFSIQIFMKIINNILYSCEQFEREIDLVLYYGSKDYIYFLENSTPFQLIDEIIIPELYEKDPYERFLVYRKESIR